MPKTTLFEFTREAVLMKKSPLFPKDEVLWEIFEKLETSIEIHSLNKATLSNGKIYPQNEERYSSKILLCKEDISHALGDLEAGLAECVWFKACTYELRPQNGARNEEPEPEAIQCIAPVGMILFSGEKGPSFVIPGTNQALFSTKHNGCEWLGWNIAPPIDTVKNEKHPSLPCLFEKAVEFLFSLGYDEMHSAQQTNWLRVLRAVALTDALKKSKEVFSSF